MTAWIVFGDPCHTASPNEEQGLVWHVRWISDVSFYIALFWIGTTTGCTFSVCRFQTCDVLLAQQSTDSVRHGTVPQFNQLIKCNVAMYSTASLVHWIHSQSTLIYFRWKWKWKVRSGCQSKTGIFPGLFVLSTNVWTGGYFVFKSFQHLSSVKFVDHQMRNQGLNVSLQLPG